MLGELQKLIIKWSKYLMKYKIRMSIIIISLLCSGLYVGFEGGKLYKDMQLKNDRITLNKEVKHQEYFIRWKIGELNNWKNQLKQDSAKTARLKGGK